MTSQATQPNANQLPQTPLYDATNHQVVAWEADESTVTTDTSVSPPITYAKARISGSFTANPPTGAVSSSNSTTTPLAANATWTGTSESILAYGSVSVQVYTDQASATNGLVIQQSQDGTNWDTKAQYSVSANTPFQITINCTGQYLQVKYTNGATLQGTFRLQTIKEVNASPSAGTANQRVNAQSGDFADGSIVAIGSTTDAAVTGDNSGSLSAKLRGLTKILADIWDSVNHRMNVSANLQIGGSNVSISNPSFNDSAARQGPVNITTAGGATGGTSPSYTGTCTANQDNSVVFASQCRTVLLHNQSSVNVPFELDVAAAATSAYIAPGQLMILDIHTTTVHLYPSNALPINAASGVIVRGWN